MGLGQGVVEVHDELEVGGTVLDQTVDFGLSLVNISNHNSVSGNQLHDTALE